MYEVQNIQLNIGLPQEFDARDIFCILKLFKFDKTSLIEVHIHVAGGNSNVLNWFHDAHKSVVTFRFQIIIIQLHSLESRI